MNCWRATRRSSPPSKLPIPRSLGPPRHNAQKAKLAALKAQQEVEAVKRREIGEKNKAREEVKAAALKAKQDAQAKNARPKDDLTRNKPAPTTASVSQAPSAPVQPVLRMPAPEGLPLARRL